MALIEFKRDPSPREVRQFALLWLPGICLVLAGWAVARSHLSWAAAAAIVAAISLILAIWRPCWVRPLYVAWMGIAFPLGWLVAHLLLAGIYFLLITPIGLILRIARRDPLARQFDREAQSYWTARETTDDRDRYFRQY